MKTAKLGGVAFVLAAVASLLVLTLVGKGSGAGQAPQPFGAAPAAWQNSSGQPIVGLMPSRASVSTFDGQALRDAQGAPVTAPLGDAARGEISAAAADAQVKAALALQQADACKRGLQVPVGVEISGTGLSAEEAAAEASAALSKAIAENGGKATKPAC
jgi:hypothetical protein